VRPPGAISLTGNSAPINVMWPERNRISLHSMRSVDFVWVNMKQLNFVVSGPKFTKFCAVTWKWL